MSLGARPEEAADVTQEAMIRAYQGWKKINYPHRWVRVVATREYMRRLYSDHEEPVGEIRGALLRPGVAAADEAAIVGPAQARVLEILRLLPSRQRQVMAWVYDGYTPKEIAEILELDPGAVRVNLHKAREALKCYLAGEGD
jgi:RNA polymerase sigma-70 factor (ECF subfamily)